MAAILVAGGTAVRCSAGRRTRLQCFFIWLRPVAKRGLGLALVSRIAVAHGGGAWIAERPGGGARVGFAVSVEPPIKP
ncbi:MAG: sensor histidine kinase [Deltaproteobacteria bacterium]|nr:sensor histidine kinase [Deltaproteobacteria bacterium]